MIKTASATVQDPIITPEAWQRMYGQKAFTGVKTAAASLIQQGSSKYLLSHCSIVGSVQVEKPPYDYHIVPQTAAMVNSNHDCWSNAVLKASYRSFIGAFNFEEHYQNSHAAKGHIIDAILRKIMVVPPSIYVYICDILVATDYKHTDLISKIKSGEYNSMSMGARVPYVFCTYCGLKVDDNTTPCVHLQFQKGSFIPDQDGVPRVVAELCGHESDPLSNVFTEASWVHIPAFKGALRRSTVSEEWIGPKTPFTAKAANQNTRAFVKTAAGREIRQLYSKERAELSRLLA